MSILISSTAATTIERGASIATSDDQGNVALKVLIAAILLVIASIAVIRWFYPFAIEDLEHEIQSIFKILQDNTTLEFDLLGDCAWGFRARLAVYVFLYLLKGDVDQSS